MQPDLNDSRAYARHVPAQARHDVCSPASRVRAAIFLHERGKSPRQSPVEEAEACCRAHLVADGIMGGPAQSWRHSFAAGTTAPASSAPGTEWALEDYLIGVADYVEQRGAAHGMPEGLRYAMAEAVFRAASEYLTGGAA